MQKTLALLFTLLLAAAAGAEELHVVRGTKIHLSDVVRELPSDVADLELGDAAPPGGSRVLDRREIESIAKKSGVSLAGLPLPGVVRVSSAAKRWSNDELVADATPALLRSLPLGVSVKLAKTQARLVTSPNARVAAVKVIRLPRREGDFSTTAMIELENEGAVVARVPLALTLDIGPEAAAPPVSKGARVQLVIESGPARVTATAVALGDCELGDVVQFRVAQTQKILYGKLETSTLARVVQ